MEYTKIKFTIASKTKENGNIVEEAIPFTYGKSKMVVNKSVKSWWRVSEFYSGYGIGYTFASSPKESVRAFLERMEYVTDDSGLKQDDIIEFNRKQCPKLNKSFKKEWGKNNELLGVIQPIKEVKSNGRKSACGKTE